jgi:hypothetical protein
MFQGVDINSLGSHLYCTNPPPSEAPIDAALSGGIQVSLLLFTFHLCAKLLCQAFALQSVWCPALSGRQPFLIRPAHAACALEVASKCRHKSTANDVISVKLLCLVVVPDQFNRNTAFTPLPY